MSSSKKSGSLYRITLTFDMNDEGCSVPNLTITRDVRTEISCWPVDADGKRPTTLLYNEPIHMGDLTREQVDAINTRIFLASNGWVHSTYRAARRRLFKDLRRIRELAETAFSGLL